ncbi:MAG: ABC transporter ATP-binding protein [Blastocatellia bacterium]
MLELRQLNFHYPRRPEREIISDVSLEVERGELVALLGPNGSGKSTLLQLAAGLLTAQRGEVLADGQPVTAMSRREIARRIGVVGPNREIRFPLTALEYVLTGRYASVPAIGFDTDSDITIARQSLRETNALQFAARQMGELSAGERQRVALARAMAQEPGWLLLDEPTANADLAHQISLLELIRELITRKGLGAIIVTHDLNLVAEFADRALFLKGGHLVAGGRPSEVMSATLLNDIFEVPLLVDRHPRSGNPRVSWQRNS